MKVSGLSLGARSKKRSLQSSGKKAAKRLRKPSLLLSSTRAIVCARLPWKSSSRRWRTTRWQVKTAKSSLVRFKENLEVLTPSSKEKKSSKINSFVQHSNEDERDGQASKRKRNISRRRKKPKMRNMDANSEQSKRTSKHSCIMLKLRSSGSESKGSLMWISKS